MINYEIGLSRGGFDNVYAIQYERERAANSRDFSII
jgi:hypothetical protein